GGQPYVAGPPAIVLTYEFIMMGLIVSTFLGVLWESAFPSFGPKRYHPEVTGGSFGVAFRAPATRIDEIVDILLANGASNVVVPEHWTL
ncbi:MAG: quinol:electron acceptor oxidoreductase subunit ActD, partial [Anaerolineae bacterium]